ncbi:hypothetical protein [Rheinheimera sp. UJ63]|uniref:hypothetical protein n=1 Tax=Rheinheimera sp. UJ63 TaxID=2910157 RepID=UPI001F31C055|nr:hypothetical protein [Rheinheimera sp. UJ63]MCF4010556.1 hypothetical protein [Rheinheimera sp. UJ63]
MKKNALIILEAPWDLRKNDQNVVSVLPFFQGLERLNGNFDLYHSQFYETNSFEMALDQLTKLDYKRYYIYIASHGYGNRLQNIKLETVLGKINNKAQHKNIVGVVIGACLVGRNTSYFGAYTESSNIVWKFGYKCAVNWLDGTLLDLKIFDSLLNSKNNDFLEANKLIRRFRGAVSLYDPTESIGTDISKIDENGKEHEPDMAIKDSLTLVIQPKGQGHKAKDYSSELFDIDD